MKIQCHSRELLEAITLVSAVVPSNPTRPVLQSVRMTASNSGLRVEGTDLEVGLSAQVDEVMVETEGMVVIPCQRLHGILRETHSPEVSLTEDGDGNVSIESGRSHFKVPCGPADEFPEIEFQPPSPALTLPREKMLQGMKRVQVAAARDATRFQMHSVLFDCADDGIRMVSTDGKRMAVSHLEIDSSKRKGVNNGQYILPLKGAELLSRILAGEGEEEVELHLDQNEVTYSSDRVSLSCRLVEGRFPEYERAIPESIEQAYDVSVEELMSALKQASLMTTKETNSVRFEFSEEALQLSTFASNVGESQIEIPVEKTSGDEGEFVIHFNPVYLIELLKAVDSSKVRCGFLDRRTAGLFSIPEDEMAYRHIVMPLVVQDGQSD